MIIENRTLFEDAVANLGPHLGHKMTTSGYGDFSHSGLAIDCEDCHDTIIEFLPRNDSERLDPEKVRYEGHYDAARDVCYVAVFKPGKSPYPMQERQDLINHSPTGISWSYGGSGPAQCAFALLMDYLGDEDRALELYQHFKFKVIAGFPTNSGWMLSGREIEAAIFRIVSAPKSC
jgi:hypothetical protein